MPECLFVFLCCPAMNWLRVPAEEKVIENVLVII